MKREIKFRVWDGVFMDYDIKVDSCGAYGIPDEVYNTPHTEVSRYPDESKIMQFTGLIDKHGIEFYEGDYLVDRYPIDVEDLSKGYHESLLPVVWCSKTLQWCVDVSFAKDGSYLTSLVEYFGEFLEVKGNIYENPQL